VRPSQREPRRAKDTSRAFEMELTPTRHVNIEGTIVTASVDSADEARFAIKELKQKKREIAHLKKTLAREKKAARARLSNAKRKPAQSRGFFDWTRAAIGALTRGADTTSAPARPRDLKSIERDYQRLDEIAHNIDAVIVQLEGRLLHMSGG
jgi:hypothetical protein